MASYPFSPCSESDPYSCIPAVSASYSPLNHFSLFGDNGAVLSTEENGRVVLAFTGPLVEVWGQQTLEDESNEGNSTYVIDGEPPIMNANFTQNILATATMLFGKSGLSPGSHTLSITNVGVQLTLGYFKVQETGATPTSDSSQAGVTEITPSGPNAASTKTGPASIPMTTPTSMPQSQNTIYTVSKDTGIYTNVTPTSSTGETTDTCTQAGPADSTTLPLQPRRNGPSTALIAVAVVAAVLFVLLIAACIRLYKKRAHDKDRAIGFPAETSSTHRMSSPDRRPWKRGIKGEEERGRFSLTTSMVPTLPAYGYTSQDLRFIPESDTGKTDSIFPDEGGNKVYSAYLGLHRVPDTDWIHPRPGVNGGAGVESIG